MTMESLKLMKKAHEELQNDPVRLKAFMKSIGAYDKHRRVEGEEYNQLVTMFKMMEPVEQANNQHTWTDTYHVAERVYNVTYFPKEDEPLIEEFIKYEDEA